MDVLHEELLHLFTVKDILKESFAITKSSPRTFSLITLTLILPLSVFILVRYFLVEPFIFQILFLSTIPRHHDNHILILGLLISGFIYLIGIFIISLISTSAVVFTVASLYVSKSVSFESSLSATRYIFKRLLITFLYIFLLMTLYNFTYFLSLYFLLLIAIRNDITTSLFYFLLIVMHLLFIVVQAYITSLWHVASVISVLEPVFGLEAMKKSYQLLRGSSNCRNLAISLVLLYLFVTEGIIGTVFESFVVDDNDDSNGVMVRLVVGVACLMGLIVVNLIGLLVQSVFYYVCKSHHQQVIDKSVLCDLLGGYLGEYVPLNNAETAASGSIEMEIFQVGSN